MQRGAAECSGIAALSPVASWNTRFASRGASSDGARLSGERGSDAVVGRSEAGAAQLLGETCSSLTAYGATRFLEITGEIPRG